MWRFIVCVLFLLALLAPGLLAEEPEEPDWVSAILAPVRQAEGQREVVQSAVRPAVSADERASIMAKAGTTEFPDAPNRWTALGLAIQAGRITEVEAFRRAAEAHARRERLAEAQRERLQTRQEEERR